MNNILILSAGRRVELVSAFKESLHNLNIKGNVLCTDITPSLSAACQVADGFFMVPRATDETYIETIKIICQENHIKLVIPTIDTDLIILSKEKENFKRFGCIIAIPDIEFVHACRDKRKTSILFQKLNIPTPKIYDKNALTFPCFCKPFNGSSSIGAFPLYNQDDITNEIMSNDANMFMELISNDYIEVTVDCYFSKSNKLVCMVPRERIEIRGGEISKGVTRRGIIYDYLLPKLRIIPGVIGCITIQLFFDKKNNDIKGLEINPRFGGGYPLSLAASANYPLWLIQEYILDKSISFYEDWEQNLLMLRYDAKILSHKYPDI